MKWPSAIEPKLLKYSSGNIIFLIGKKKRESSDFLTWDNLHKYARNTHKRHTRVIEHCDPGVDTFRGHFWEEVPIIENLSTHIVVGEI